MNPDFIIQTVSWKQHEQALRLIRTQVFMYEQQVPEALEWDGLDEKAVHLLALTSSGEAIGCARLIGDGSIGRMAVVKPWRGTGVGMPLLKQAIAYYRQQGQQRITLSAQLHAVAFYEKAGFEVCSAPYLDADIMHVDMQLQQAS